MNGLDIYGFEDMKALGFAHTHRSPGVRKVSGGLTSQDIQAIAHKTYTMTVQQMLKFWGG